MAGYDLATSQALAAQVPELTAVMKDQIFFAQLCAANGSTLVTDIETLSSGLPVAGFPASDEIESCEVVSPVPTQWVAMSLSLDAACPGTFLDFHQTSSGQSRRCLASPGIPVLGQDSLEEDGAEFLTATADGGAAYMLWSGEQPFVVVVDSNTQPVAEFALQDFPMGPDFLGIWRATLIGDRWILNLQSNQTTILAYDLPGVAAALHGWTSLGGGPMRQNSPQP